MMFLKISQSWEGSSLKCYIAFFLTLRLFLLVSWWVNFFTNINKNNESYLTSLYGFPESTLRALAEATTVATRGAL